MSEASLEQSINDRTQLTNGFGIYVHIPFCVHKCSYCDFYSFTKYDDKDFETYAQRLCEEISLEAEWLHKERNYQKPVTSVFFGGGTPSLLPGYLLGNVFATIQNHFKLRADCEITLEANPETIREEVVESWRLHTPINRVSMGAQSFRPENLAALERLGDQESIRNAASVLRKFNYTNFNLDLIFGIPNQDKNQMVEDIEKAAELGPRHISSYSLTLKPGHKLFGQLPSDDVAADLYEFAVERLAALGYSRYEISNYAQTGFESRHNLLYWTGGDYLGVGTSAASRFFWDGRFRHRKQFSEYQKYMSGSVAEWETTTPAQTLLEATFLELRTSTGVNLRHFQDRYGKDLTTAPNFRLYEREGLLTTGGGGLRLTPRGLLLAETIVQGLV